MEAMDRKEREKNLVITGVPDEDEALEGATTEQDKINKIWSEVDAREVVQSHRRLGTRGDTNRRRAILVTLDSMEAKDRILTKASKLKQATGEFNKIYIKKDVHPSIRGEWRRLRAAERTEKERLENAGCVIRLDSRERKLYRDGVVTDAWNLQFFLSRPQHVRTMKMLSWNINGVKKKLEKKHVHELLQQYDIISLNEVMTPLPVAFPGYIS